MEYTNLGRTGLSVSRLCLGTMNFGPQTTEPDSFAIMDRALDSGVNFLDTANVYGGRRGEGVTEQIVGRWLAQGGGRRERIVLATGSTQYAARPVARGVGIDHVLSSQLEVDPASGNFTGKPAALCFGQHKVKLAEAWAAAGNPDSARFHLRAVDRAWQNADPPVRARLDRLHQRLALD